MAQHELQRTPHVGQCTTPVERTDLTSLPGSNRPGAPGNLWMIFQQEPAWIITQQALPSSPHPEPGQHRLLDGNFASAVGCRRGRFFPGMRAAASPAGHYYSVAAGNPDAVAKLDFFGVFGIARLAGTGRGMHVVRHCMLLHVRRFR
ncbi:hypothetical protein N7519_010193 [Penicillium mononematosum]|uniref:uncharacterized protein n=1 Tax=Penicillium mononematosum TaxID=268346 RepID=UPI00254686B1|nr:uncharacterized protein N7519_010193 [Penicillium mononematosum]KAJ6179732.1 hypothetical protein N7519_010193 [Penicillium mononematosum]